MRLLYATRSWSTHDQRFLEAWKRAGVEVASISADESWKDGGSGAAFSVRLNRQITEFRPDVVHAGPLSDVAPTVASVWSGPLIAMSWGFDLLKDIKDDARVRDHVAAVLRRADHVIVDNDAPAGVAISLGADAQSVSQFPWGIDIGAFTPGPSGIRAELGWGASDFVVLSTRRHEHIYDVETVVSAFTKASTQAPNLRLLVAGSGSLTGTLLQMLGDAGLSDHVQFLGEVRQADLPEVYRAADLYVSASLVDGSSVSLLEAMGTGVVACVSDIPGNHQWISGGRGVVFGVGDVDSLAAQILSFLEDKDSGGDTAKAIADRARSFVEEHADWSKTGGRLAAIAAAAVAGNRKRT